MHPIAELMRDRDFITTAMTVMQHQLWCAEHTTTGPEPHVIVTHAGTGRGAPQYAAFNLTSWRAKTPDGWEPVAYINRTGTITQEEN